MAEWVLGVRPEFDGLRIDPCLPPGWDRARMTRPWRGAVWEIEIERGVATDVEVDGVRIAGSVIPVPAQPGGRHRVHATFV